MILSWKKLLLALPFAIQFLYVLQGVLAFPYATGDAYGIWFLKAKVLYLSGWPGFLHFLQDSHFTYSHPSYPILLPLIFAGVYILSGQINEWLVMALYPLIYLLLVVLLYRLLKQQINKWWAYIGTFLWATTPVIERAAGRFETGFADLPLSLTILIGTIYSLKFIEKPKWPYLVLAILGLGMAANIKFEGLLWLVSLLIAGLLVRQKKIIRPLGLILIISFMTIIPWLTVVSRYGLELDYAQNLNSVLIHLPRLPSIVWGWTGEIFKFRRWGLSWLAPLLILVLSWRKIRERPFLKLITLALVMQILGESFIYLVSPIEVTGHLHASLYRLIIQTLG